MLFDAIPNYALPETVTITRSVLIFLLIKTKAIHQSSIHNAEPFLKAQIRYLAAIAVVGEEVGRARADVRDNILGRQVLDALAKSSWRAGTLESDKVSSKTSNVLQVVSIRLRRSVQSLLLV